MGDLRKGQKMKRRNYVVLMIIGTLAMVLMLDALCKAEWIWIGSDVASGPWSGNGGDDYWQWWFSVTDINTSANSSGASASARCQASIYAYPDSFGGTVARGDSVWCASWGRSLYAWHGSLPSDDLIIDWSVSGSGHVKVLGGVYDRSMHEDDTGSSSAFAYGEIDGYEYGNGCAGGSVTRGSNGSAYVGWYGHATEDSNDVYNGDPNSYGAEMYYSVSGSEDDVPLENLTQYTAWAEVESSVSCNASITVTPGYYGITSAYAYSDTDGDSSVSVRW